MSIRHCLAPVGARGPGLVRSGPRPCAPRAALLLALAVGAAPAQEAVAPLPFAALTPPVEADASAPAAVAGYEVRGQLKAERYTTLSSEIGARIRSLPVREAGAFDKGEVLVEFDCSVPRAQLAKAVADLEGAQQTLKANERLATLNSVGQLELELARSAVAQAQAEIGLQQAIVSKCAVTAPFDGRVAEQKAREQQFVQPGEPVMEILDDRNLELEALVPSAWLLWLQPGQSLSVTIDETGKTYAARFSRIGARVDPVSQSVKVTAVLDGTHAELKPGMSGRIEAGPP